MFEIAIMAVSIGYASDKTFSLAAGTASQSITNSPSSQVWYIKGLYGLKGTASSEVVTLSKTVGSSDVVIGSANMTATGTDVNVIIPVRSVVSVSPGEVLKVTRTNTDDTLAGFVSTSGDEGSMTIIDADLTGNLVGNVTGNVTGDLTGDATGVLVNTDELTTQAGAGVTGGTGTVYKTSVEWNGDVKKVTMFVDLTGLSSAGTLGDIIGTGTNAAHFGSISTNEIATVLAMRVECVEVPAGGEVDIDIYEATEATGVYDGAVGDLAETAVLARAGDWAAGDVKYASSLPTAGKYLYLTTGTDTTPTADVYTGGKFLIEIIGY